MSRLGGEGALCGDVMPCFAEATGLQRGFASGDRAIFLAMRQTEADCSIADKRVVRRRDIAGRVALIAERALADKRLHCAWMDQYFSSFKTNMGSFFA